MAWVYVPGQAGLKSDSELHSEAITAACVWWKGKRMQPHSLRRAWQKAHWMRVLSGMMCAPSTAQRGVDQLILSAQESRAKGTPSRASVNSKPTLATSGPTRGESFAKLVRGAFSSKTCQASLFPTEQPDSPPLSFGFSRSWPKMGSMRNGECSRRPRWVPATNASGFSCWPTSGANGAKGSHKEGQRRGPLNEVAEHWPTPDKSASEGGRTSKHPPTGVRPSGAKRAITINDAAAFWQTPKSATGEYQYVGDKVYLNLEGEAALWATPRAEEHKEPVCSEQAKAKGFVALCEQSRMSATPKASDGHKPSAGKRSASDLSHQVRSIHDGRELSPTTRTLRPQLNAAFVNWLMGMPFISWTNIAHTSYGHAEMQSFLCAQRSRLRCLIGD